jgi:hypothetical protein
LDMCFKHCLKIPADLKTILMPFISNQMYWHLFGLGSQASISCYMLEPSESRTFDVVISSGYKTAQFVLKDHRPRQKSWHRTNHHFPVANFRKYDQV